MISLPLNPKIKVIRNKLVCEGISLKDGLEAVNQLMAKQQYREALDIYEQLYRQFPKQAVQILAGAYDTIYQSLRDTNRYWMYQSRFFDFQIQPRDKVLDIGSGHLPFPFATHLADFAVEDGNYGRVGAEFKRIEGKPVYECNVEQMPFADKEFDFVYCSHVLEHVESPEKACRELMRIAKRGYIETPTKGKDIFFDNARVSNHRWSVDLFDNHLVFTEYNLEEIKGLECNVVGKMLSRAESDKEKALCILELLKADVLNTMLYWEQNFDYEVRRIFGVHTASTKIKTKTSDQPSAKNMPALCCGPAHTFAIEPVTSGNSRNVPVILITYKRPWHTAQVLTALKEHRIQNLYVFSDAPKTPDDEQGVYQTRKLIEAIDWTTPQVIYQKQNLGLAKSIVGAVNMVFEKHDRLILLEDDCVPLQYFFDFIYDCLQKYENDPKVFGVSGHSAPIPDSLLKDYPCDAYFLSRMSSWGWATWKRAWAHYEPDLYKLVQIANAGQIDMAQGGVDIPVNIHKMLTGKLHDVWTLPWVLSVYNHHGCYVYPTRSHLKNIGLDGTGLHCGKAPKIDWTYATTRTIRYPEQVFISELLLKNYLDWNYIQVRPDTAQKAVQYLRNLRFSAMEQNHSEFRSVSDNMAKMPALAIQNTPNENGEIPGGTKDKNNCLDCSNIGSKYTYHGLKFEYDSLPALQTEIKNIFEQKIYDFKTDKKSPLVIDGGAHLGLFSLYIKQKYPQARVIAFEPDDRAFANLNANLAENHCSQVHTVKSGLFNQNTTLHFAADGADGGAIKADGAAQIQVVKLSDYITEPVDYLKLNIEGAEMEVLEEIEPKLHLINELCLEYHAFPEIGQRLHQILALLDRNGFRYLIHDFDKETNPATKPPFSISPKSRFYLLIYAKRIYAKTNLSTAEPLKLLKPVSRKFGFDRGTPIDRIFIDQFLSQNRDLIRGTVLEIAESKYTKKFGSGVTKTDILHAVEGNPNATVVGNLETGENIPENRYDCIILTQTLHVIYDYRSVIKNCHKALKENGVLLLTAPGISQISRYDMDRWGDYWRFTTLSLKKIFGEQFGEENVDVRNFGNYQLAAEFLNGRAAEEIPSEAFASIDDDYQLLLGVTAVRKESRKISRSSHDNHITQTASGHCLNESVLAAAVVPDILSRSSMLEHPLVLLYHRVAEDPIDSQLLSVSPKNFEGHLKELKTNYRVVPLRQLLHEVQIRQTRPNTVALTFDDGYLDNLTEALPLLEKYQIHATIFATAGNIEQGRGFWWDKLEYLFLGQHSLPKILDVSDDEKEYKWPLCTVQQRLIAYDQITALLKGKSNNEVEAFVQGLLQWACLRVNVDCGKPVLSISQLQQVSQSPWIEIGAHTLTHARLGALPVAQQEKEIVDSRKKLESWIGKPVTLFSYPYGSKWDFTSQTKSLVRQAGFHAGMANIQASVSPNMDIFEVPRRLVRNWSGNVFAEWMRSENKGLLEKQTLAQRTDTLVRFTDSYRQDRKDAGQECIVTG